MCDSQVVVHRELASACDGCLTSPWIDQLTMKQQWKCRIHSIKSLAHDLIHASCGARYDSEREDSFGPLKPVPS